MLTTDVRKMLGANIKKERTRRNLTRSALANMLGVNSPSTIGNWESGMAAPDISKICMLAELFQVSTDYLCGRKAAVIAEQNCTTVSSSLSDNERNLLEKYSLCDEIGQETIENCVDFQYTRCIARHFRERPEKSKNTTGIQKVFLEENIDPQYAELEEKLSALRILKIGSKKSFMDITQYLWDLGYGSDICLEYVLDIFGKGSAKRVPCERLYRHIENYLRGNYWVGSV